MIDAILTAIETELKKNNQEFFSYAWRENITNILENESRFNSLLKWIDSKIELLKININLFNPADKTADYTNETFNTYFNALREFALLINMREILISNTATTEMRNNVEYTLCKIFKIHYNNNLKEYC